MQTNNTFINNAIVDSVFNEDCHVREHMADIIGAKHIKEAFSCIEETTCCGRKLVYHRKYS